MRRNEYLWKIKPNDAKNLKEVVNILKENGLSVCATGSSMAGGNYNDIDIIAYGIDIFKDNYGMFSKSMEALKKDSKAKVLFTHNKSASEELIEEGFEPGGLFRGPYVDSIVEGRYKINLNGSIIDISFSKKPFKLKKDAERVEL